MTFPLEWRIATHAFIDICHMGTKCARDEGEEGRMQQVCPPYKKYLIHSCNLLMSYLALKHMFCNSYWARGNKDSHAHLDIIFYLHVRGLKDSVCSLYQCWAVLTFLWEPSSPGFLMMLWEPDRFSNIYIYIYIGLVRPIRLSKRIELTPFSDKSVFICTTTTGFHNLIIKIFIN
jgi:hypothetical protein